MARHRYGQLLLSLALLTAVGLVALYGLSFSNAAADSHWQNEVDNASFEEWEEEVLTPWGPAQLPDDWFPENVFSCCAAPVASQAIKPTTPHTGTFGLRLGDPFTSGYQIGVYFAQDVKIKGGQRYNFSCYARNPGGYQGDTRRCFVVWLDKDKNPVSTPPSSFLVLPSSITYVQLSGSTGPAPCNARFARIRLDKADFGFADFDDISLVEDESLPRIKC